MTNHNKSAWKKKKRENKSRAIGSKETEGSLECMISKNRSTHPPFYKASRVPRQLRVPRKVPTPIAHH